MALVRRPSRAQVAGLALRTNGGDNGIAGGNVVEIDLDDDYVEDDAANLAWSMKSGNINQGYAQCGVDRLAIAVQKGKCSPERIQCRQVASLRATNVVGGAIVTFTIKPEGLAFVREIITVFSEPTTPGDEFVAVLQQMNAKGRFAVTGEVTSTGTGSIASGILLDTYSPALQNYVAPSGIIFSSANALKVVIRNDGADVGSFRVAVTYDEVRDG